jgi:hypothetical protein
MGEAAKRCFSSSLSQVGQDIKLSLMTFSFYFQTWVGLRLLVWLVLVIKNYGVYSNTLLNFSIHFFFER